MEKVFDSNMQVGFVKFVFRDEDDEIFASFKIKPTDPRLQERCKNISAFFAELATQQPKTAIEWEDVVESKFCELLGYDCRQSLFGRVAATEVINGQIFAQHILRAIVREVGPYVRRSREARISKHTEKYTK